MDQLEIDALKAHILELEEHLKYLYKKMNMDYAEGDSKTGEVKIRELLLQKRRPEAIAMYAAMHNVSPGEAQKAIDAIDRMIGA